MNAPHPQQGYIHEFQSGIAEEKLLSCPEPLRVPLTSHPVSYGNSFGHEGLLLDALERLLYKKQQKISIRRNNIHLQMWIAKDSRRRKKSLTVIKSNWCRASPWWQQQWKYFLLCTQTWMDWVQQPQWLQNCINTPYPGKSWWHPDMQGDAGSTVMDVTAASSLQQQKPFKKHLFLFCQSNIHINHTVQSQVGWWYPALITQLIFLMELLW